MTRPSARQQQQHTVQILWAKPPGGGPVLYGWQCTCGDHETFTGLLPVSSALTSARMHVYLWGGQIG